MMKIKFSTSILALVATLFFFSPQAALGQNKPQLITDKNLAAELTGVESRTIRDWNFALGEGTEEIPSRYEIKQTNRFFNSLPAELEQHHKFNAPRDSYEQVELFRF